MASRVMMSTRLAAFVTQQAHHTRRLSTVTPQLATVPDSFKSDDIKMDLTSSPGSKPDPENLGFGKVFADHMLEIDWTESSGWQEPHIKPLQKLSLHPGTMVFHSATELFEGMKAYRSPENKILLFRPEKNMARMRRSAARLVLPDFDGKELLKCIMKLIKLDQEWVPYSTKSTLYIRPTFIATNVGLDLRPPSAAKIFVFSGPVGPYYPTGFAPISLLADPKFTRSCEKGYGSYKIGPNYGQTVVLQIEALQDQDCQQCLWLYGPEHRVTEVGTMNFFVYWINEHGEEELITPSLDSGLILPGITRLSLLELAQKWKQFKVTERDFTLEDIIKALKEKRVKEIFGAGTACVACPVKEIVYQGTRHQIPTMENGAALTTKFWKSLTDIQFGRTPSDWTVEVAD